MPSSELTLVQSLKISLFSRGIGVSSSAAVELTQGGKIPLSVHEYATTGGVTLVLDGDVYVNAPFGHGFFDAPEATLFFDGDSGSGFHVSYRNHDLPVKVLPLPGYLRAQDSHGRLVTDTVFSHADRVRISPISGCVFSCKFCDFAGKRYVRRPVDQLLEGLEVAKKDTVLPVRHALTSGGTPASKDYPYFNEVCEAIVRSAGMYVDVMMPPREDTCFIDHLAELGIFGYAINLELYDEESARRIIREKQRLGLRLFSASIERALEVTGGNGRVRSLIVVGLETEEQSLRGVEYLAKLGCDPVLSPFRPAPGTALADHPPPTPEMLEHVYLEAVNIVERYGVKLGPRCVPCQHNTLTFPDESGAYYFS